MTIGAVEERWRELTAAALLGVERQAPPLGPTGAALDALLGRLDTADRAGALLGATAAVALYRRAGQRPRRLDPTEEAPARPDELPSCSPSAAARLGLMLGGQHDELLPEWLAALAAAGRRAPPRHLPDLLEVGRTRRALRPAVLAVLGPRGHWLAAQNPAWSYAVGGGEVDPEQTWTTGDREARLGLLGHLREGEPDRARDLLASTWAEEGPDDRAAFLGAFRVGLGPADEPFLEAALDDRRKEVRVLAAGLLTGLAGSALVGRMLERVGPLLTLERERRLLGLGAERRRLAVALPAAPDPAATRDGVSGRRLAVPGVQLGDRASHLAELLAAIPPSTWSRQWGASPAELIEAAGQAEHRAALLHGWRLAAERHRDAEWAEALLAVDETPAAAVPSLVAVLPPARREALALARLRARGGRPAELFVQGRPPVVLVLGQCLHPWSVDLARTVLDRVRQAAADSRATTDWQLRTALVGFAGYVPPALLAEASAGWPTEAPTWPTWRESVGGFLAVLQFRQEMLEEIAR